MHFAICSVDFIRLFSMYYFFHRESASLQEFFLLALFVRCGGDSFSYAEYSVKGHAVIIPSHPQTRRNTHRNSEIRRAVSCLQAWVGRTSMGLNFNVFQNINLLKSKDYILQLAHSEVYRGSSHPRLCSDCPIRNPSPANRATREPPPQRTKRARRKSSGGAAVGRGGMQ